VPNIYDSSTGIISIWIVPSDVYTIPEVYQVSDFYFFGTSNVVFGTYTSPCRTHQRRRRGLLVASRWTAEAIPSSRTSSIGPTSSSSPTSSLGGERVHQGGQHQRVVRRRVRRERLRHHRRVRRAGNLYVRPLPPDGSATGGFYVGRPSPFRLYVESDDPNTIPPSSVSTRCTSREDDHYISRSITAGGITITFTPDGSATAAALQRGPGGDDHAGLPSGRRRSQRGAGTPHSFPFPCCRFVHLQMAVPSPGRSTSSSRVLT